LKFILLFLFLINIQLCASAQNAEAFDKIYYKTYLETSQTDFKKALHIADSLYKHSSTATYQVKSLMLSASLLQQTGDLSRAVDYAEKAQEIVIKTNDYNWQARIAGFLASQYRLLKLYAKSSVYTNKAMAAAEKINNPEVADNLIGLMHQEKAYYQLDQKSYRKAIAHVLMAQRHFNHTRQDLNFLTANNEQLLGDSYQGLQLYDSALYYYRNGLKSLGHAPGNFLNGLIMNGMALTYLQQGKLPEAHRWLDSAQAIADGSNYLQLKNVIYETERAYAEKVKDMDRLTEAQKKQDTVRSVLADRKDSFLNHTLEHLENNYNIEAKRGSYKNILILIAVIIIIGTIAFLMVQRRQQKARFRKILERMREREVMREHKIAQNTPVQEMPKEVVHQAADKSAAPKEPDAAMMTEETMQKILNSLEVFETGTLFNNRNMSLSFLASHFNTNTRYLSRVINHHKHKDFSSYINELRINYIVEKLKNDPVWRQYKISTLAEETGFSSHGKFTPVFKSITGLSPSLFIKYLEEDAQQEQ